MVNGDPFTSVYPGNYWTSTTLAPNTEHAFYVYPGYGVVSHYPKTYSACVWPVRDR